MTFRQGGPTARAGRGLPIDAFGELLWPFERAFGPPQYARVAKRYTVVADPTQVRIAATAADWSGERRCGGRGPGIHLHEGVRRQLPAARGRPGAVGAGPGGMRLGDVHLGMRVARDQEGEAVAWQSPG